MSKKINKTMARKIATRAAIEKKKAQCYGATHSSFSFDDDYYSSADHLSYEDLGDLLALPTRTTGKI